MGLLPTLPLPPRFPTPSPESPLQAVGAALQVCEDVTLVGKIDWQGIWFETKNIWPWTPNHDTSIFYDFGLQGLTY